LGKPYWSELERLPETFAWANEVNIHDFVRVARLAAGSRLVAIGSGGSYSAAVLASYLHNRYTGQLALTATPLLAAGISGTRDDAAFIFSAGGRNSDVLGICQSLIAKEPASMGVVCLRSESPLGRLCRRYEFVGCTELDMPSGKDGFVATNSLVAFGTILCRAYSSFVIAPCRENRTLCDLLRGSQIFDGWVQELRDRSKGLWQRNNLIVLYGSAMTQAAVLDLESKFSEAAIGSVQVTDFRNFAHGRHHGLDKREADTAVLAFVTPDEQELANRTFALLPKRVPVLQVPINETGGYGALAALVTSLYLTGFAAESRGIDPGRPHVKQFGRRIYHLNAWTRARAHVNRNEESVAIERKVGATVLSMSSPDLEYWRRSYERFITGLRSTSFNALILDYDGTLCDEKFRFSSLPTIVQTALNRILGKGVCLGIATGRGDSVLKALRDGVRQKFWPLVTVAYHNGSEIGPLNDDGILEKRTPMNEILATIEYKLNNSHMLHSIAEWKSRTQQISVIAKNPGESNRLYRIVCDLISDDFRRGISCVRSSHSVDILAPGVGKEAIFSAIKGLLGLPKPTFLCIGDLGSWPGNDFQLLRVPFSLSVHQVSQNPDTCWNIAPRGFRNCQATRYLLEHIDASHGIIRFRMESRKPNRNRK
jgi:hydroxymethylpyrimidine pyrophosphatase-like HAD family hydrolase/fructoselysine-6-P-deglycase FrlB-like protein